MSYAIRITRNPPLTLTEWESAVGAIKDARLSTSDVQMKNTKTGAVISFSCAEGDAEIGIGSEWFPCFSWRESGEIIFRAPDDFDEPDGPVRSIARKLAERLRARLVGEEGEEIRRSEWVKG
jgi:hypothetical protein